MTAIPARAERHRPGHAVLRTRFFAFRFNARVLSLVALAAALLALFATWAMTLGSYPISIPDVFLAAIGQGEDRHEFIVQDLRLPRTLAALMVGGALAMSGAIFQGLVRNELVSPDIIGINSGAAGIGFAWLLITRNTTALPLVMFTGAMGMAMLIYLLSWKGGIDPSRLILIGIGLQSVLTAVETFLVRRFPIDDIIWADNLLLGSVGTATWDDIQLLAIGMAVFVPAALFMSWPLRALQLGDDVAKTAGLPVELVRIGLIAVGCWLSALSIAVAGLVAFIALMVPHAARMIAGPMSASVMLFTAVLGGALLLGADVVGNHILPVSLPVSVLIGAIGAPYFLFLFWRSGVRL